MSNFDVEPVYTVTSDDGYRVEYRENGDMVDATLFKGDEIVADYPHALSSRQFLFELNAEYWIQEARNREQGLYAQEAPDATEAARDRALEMSVDLQKVEGAGKDGKITAQDVNEAAKEQQQ